jgi:hypothetical protein
MIVEITNKLEINFRASERINGKKAWCELPYPGHKKGGPNYGKGCPLPRVNKFSDLSKPHWFAIIKFDLKGHVEKMKNKHPDWSDRQNRCVLYWQNGVRSKLNKICQEFIGNKDLIYHKIPEAMGVNVILTMKKLNIPIEIKPVNTVHKITLIGSPYEIN